MAQKINFLESVPKIVRDVGVRRQDKEENRRIAREFGCEYFDGPRTQGYGGYVYDGRWKSVARKLIDHYGLGPGDRVPDIGCAKGCPVHALREALPGLEAAGIDVSPSALSNRHAAIWA